MGKYIALRMLHIKGRHINKLIITLTKKKDKLLKEEMIKQIKKATVSLSR